MGGRTIGRFRGRAPGGATHILSRDASAGGRRGVRGVVLTVACPAEYWPGGGSWPDAAGQGRAGEGRRQSQFPGNITTTTPSILARFSGVAVSWGMASAPSCKAGTARYLAALWPGPAPACLHAWLQKRLRRGEAVGDR